MKGDPVVHIDPSTLPLKRKLGLAVVMIGFAALIIGAVLVSLPSRFISRCARGGSLPL